MCAQISDADMLLEIEWLEKVTEKVEENIEDEWPQVNYAPGPDVNRIYSRRKVKKRSLPGPSIPSTLTKITPITFDSVLENVLQEGALTDTPRKKKFMKVRPPNLNLSNLKLSNDRCFYEQGLDGWEKHEYIGSERGKLFAMDVNGTKKFKFHRCMHGITDKKKHVCNIEELAGSVQGDDWNPDTHLYEVLNLKGSPARLFFSVEYPSSLKVVRDNVLMEVITLLEDFTRNHTGLTEHYPTHFLDRRSVVVLDCGEKGVERFRVIYTQFTIPSVMKGMVPFVGEFRRWIQRVHVDNSLLFIGGMFVVKPLIPSKIKYLLMRGNGPENGSGRVITHIRGSNEYKNSLIQSLGGHYNRGEDIISPLTSEMFIRCMTFNT